MRTKSAGCTVAIDGHVNTDRPIFVTKGTHITGLTDRARVISRNRSVNFNGSVFSFGLVTRYSFARLFANNRYFNVNGATISEARENSRYISIDAAPNGDSSSFDESFQVGSQIMLVDRFHPGCDDDQHCANGFTNWLSALSSTPTDQLYRTMIEPPRTMSLNIIEAISWDRRLITLRHPVSSRIGNPLIVNYSADTYVNPGIPSGSQQKQFFSQDSSISDLTLSSTFTPALVQGCVNCLFQNVTMGIDGFIPRNMVYGNAAVRSLYADIKGKFSRHSIELAIGSEYSTIKRIDANQGACTEPNCNLLFKAHEEQMRECLPMSLGLTERANSISIQRVRIRDLPGLNYCVLTALALTGNGHRISDVSIGANTAKTALEIRESIRGLALERVQIDAGVNLETAYGLLESTRDASLSRIEILHSSRKRLRTIDNGTHNTIEHVNVTYSPQNRH